MERAKVLAVRFVLLFAIVLVSCSSNKVSGTIDGGSGTDGDTDVDGDSDSDSDSDTFDECASVSEEAHSGYAPADIIFVIDNTPSMEDEIAEVRANMNAFSQTIIDFGIDAHVIVISCLPGECGNSGGGSTNYGICIDPPLGAVDGCQAIDGEEELVTNDDNPPVYTHVSTRVPSVKDLEWILDNYPDYSSALRPGAQKHIVVVSDDTDETTSTAFDAALLALDPPTFAGYKFHGIFSYMSKEEGCAADPVDECCEFAAPGGEGVPYAELVALTGGVSGDLCLQDFDGVFAAVATSVTENAVLSCEWEIPAPPEDMEFDPEMVNVVYDDGLGGTQTIGHVDSAEDCADVEHGWYYDDPENPQWIYVCPQTCDFIQGNEGSSIVIEFGCETEYADPV